MDHWTKSVASHTREIETDTAVSLSFADVDSLSPAFGQLSSSMVNQKFNYKINYKTIYYKTNFLVALMLALKFKEINVRTEILINHCFGFGLH